MLINRCLSNGLVIGGTLFPHKEIQKLTWTFPDGTTKNMIDHIVINRKWVKSMRNLRVHRGADVGSDHHLLITNIKLKLRRTKKSSKTIFRRRFDAEKIQPVAKKNELILQLKNKFDCLENLGEDVKNTWNNIETTYCSVAKEVLGYKSYNEKDWIAEKTWNKIEEIKGKLNNTQSERQKDKLRKEYHNNNKNKEIKTSARKDKQKFMEDLTEESQKAANKGNMSIVYRITKKLCGKSTQKQMTPIKENKDKVLTIEREVTKKEK